MIKNNALFDDIAKLASGAAGSVLEMKRELESYITTKIEHMAGNLQLVDREEFEVLQQMTHKLLADNEKMATELAALKSQLSQLQNKQ